MMKRILTTAVLVVTIAVSSSAQVNTWKSLTNMSDVRSMTVAGANIWAATGGGVFRRALDGGAYSQYTNIDGIGASDFTAICTMDSSIIIAGASNGMISVFEPGAGWSIVPDISRATDKSQRGIVFLRQYKDRVFIGTEFGLCQYSVANREFKETTVKFGGFSALIKVNGLLITSDSLWVATAKGVACAHVQSTILQDPASWSSYSMTDGLPTEAVLSLVECSGRIYAGTTDGIAVRDGAGWKRAVESLNGMSIRKLVPWQDEVIAVTDYSIYAFKADGSVRQLGDILQAPAYISGSVFRDVNVLSDGELLVSSSLGIARYEVGKPWSFKAPSGPNTNQFVSLSVDDNGILWSASGRDEAGVGTFGYDGIDWINYRKETTPEFTSNDVYCTAPGKNGSEWFGTWGFGVVRRDPDGTLNRYDANNTAGFPGIPKNEKFSPIPSIATDGLGQTWILHHLSGNGKVISCYGTDGMWRFYSCPILSGELESSKLCVDSYGNKWILVPTLGILMFNDNGTLDNVNDDTWKFINRTTSTGLSSATPSDMVVDRMGDLWVGTDMGIRTIFSPTVNSKVVLTCYVTTCNIEGIPINCLAVDPVNNKWIGTKSGVFVLSSDGGTIIHQYTTENSPLLDNDVRTIVIHPQTGVAYIGTNKGLSALTTAYATAVDQMSKLTISPNPFHPNQTSRVVIDGLAEGSSLKVLTVSGDLVAELTTPGGRMGFWNGRNKEGKPVASGIYFIVAFNSDGSQIARAKVAVIQD